jgi:cob(I)alamin adenosyltransferase
MFGEKGLVHLYTGDGKGKTTASLGLAVRAAGHGARVLIVQFMKGSDIYGELNFMKSIPSVSVVTTGRDVCIGRGDETDADTKEAHRGLEIAKAALKDGSCDMLIADEIVVAASFGLLSQDEVMSLIDAKPYGTELVLTGRGAWPELIERCDLVTQMKKLKHPYDLGITSRKGVEF